MNQLIPGLSNKVHIPDALHLERHTTAGAKQTHGLMDNIMRRISMHWTDNEAQKKVLEQKGKLLNALTELSKVNNDPTTKPAQTLKQLEKIAKLIQEIEIWEGKKILGFKTAEDSRYKERLSKERFNALYKDFHGGRNILYRGYKKVTSHVMFGVLVVAATTIINLAQ